MSTDSGQPEAGLCRRGGGRVRANDVQPGEATGGSPDARAGADDETDWRQAFRVLSATLSRQMVSGDLLYLVALSIRDNAGVEPAREFAEHVGLNRDRRTHTFMG